MAAADRVPVLVAGAGPVGLVSALLLARWQVPTVVLEAGEAGAAEAGAEADTHPAAGDEPAGSRAICFQRDVLDVLDRVGCAEDMVSEGVTWTTGRTYFREHELFSVSFPSPSRSALPPWINISQASVERYLRRRAEAQPLVDLRYGYPVTGLRQAGSEVEAAARPVTGPVSLRGSHLIGADGARSAVRRLLGVEFPGRSFDDQFLICDIRADLPFPSERRFYFDPPWNPGRQVLVHQCPGSAWRIDWQVPAGFDLAAERASGALDSRIREITGDTPYEIIWSSVYRFHQRVASAFRSGNAFLAGDAAHLYAPFGARGLNSGIQDAENLAWKIAFACRGWAGPGLLGSYAAERRAAALENLRVTSATMEFLVPQTAVQSRRRAATLRGAVHHPAARARVDSGKLAEPFWYLDSPLTTPASAAPPASAARPEGPEIPPAPGMLCPDGPCLAGGQVTRLRRLFGSGYVVLTGSATDASIAAGIARRTLDAPVSCRALDDIDTEGALRATLRATPTSVHLIRPDGHLAAVLASCDPRALAAALRHAAGHQP